MGRGASSGIGIGRGGLTGAGPGVGGEDAAAVGAEAHDGGAHPVLPISGRVDAGGAHETPLLSLCSSVVDMWRRCIETRAEWRLLSHPDAPSPALEERRTQPWRNP